MRGKVWGDSKDLIIVLIGYVTLFCRHAGPALTIFYEIFRSASYTKFSCVFIAGSLTYNTSTFKIKIY